MKILRLILIGVISLPILLGCTAYDLLMEFKESIALSYRNFNQAAVADQFACNIGSLLWIAAVVWWLL